MTQLRWITTDQPKQQTSLFDAVIERHIGRGAYKGLEFFHVEAKTLINQVPGGRFAFDYTINAYRGCSHACNYCFARPSHDYLGLNIGSDFDHKIVVKINAPELVRYETAPVRWPGSPIAMGTNTDPYQPAEGKYRLTRQIIEILAERGNPFSILTKSPLVLRDLDVLKQAATRTKVSVNFSVGTLDPEVWAATEPGTPNPRKRLDAVARLNQAGISSGVLMMPILPGLSDRPEQIEEVVKGATEAGAQFIAGGYLHLRGPMKSHFFDWLGEKRPDLTNSYRQFYQRGAYASKPNQDRLGRTIASLKQKHRPAGRLRPNRNRPKPPARSKPIPQPTQSALPLTKAQAKTRS